jgi:hypothetical protein
MVVIAASACSNYFVGCTLVGRTEHRAATSDVISWQPTIDLIVCDVTATGGLCEVNWRVNCQSDGPRLYQNTRIRRFSFFFILQSTDPCDAYKSYHTNSDRLSQNVRGRASASALLTIALPLVTNKFTRLLTCFLPDDRDRLILQPCGVHKASACY